MALLCSLNLRSEGQSSVEQDDYQRQSGFTKASFKKLVSIMQGVLELRGAAADFTSKKPPTRSEHACQLDNPCCRAELSHMTTHSFCEEADNRSFSARSKRRRRQ